MEENNKPPHTLLLVDDEENILAALKRTLRKEGFNLHTADGGAAGLEFLAQNSVSVVISDQRMPEMTGAEFLHRVKENYPETMRIMLTGYADKQDIIDAINQGEIFRFITKPWDDDSLMPVIHQAVIQYELLQDNRRLHAQVAEQNAKLKSLNEKLEHRVEQRTVEIQSRQTELQDIYNKQSEDLFAVLKGFARMVDKRDTYEGSHSQRVAVLSVQIAESLELPPGQIRSIEMAATLHDIGKLTLSDELLQMSEKLMTGQSRRAIRTHPVVGQECLMELEAMHEVGLLIRHHHERFDGKGYPDGLSSEDIPLGARIIAMANMYDGSLNVAYIDERINKVDVLDDIVSKADTHFDPIIIERLIAVLASLEDEDSQSIEQEISLEMLKPGMTVSQDLKTRTGLVLVTRNTEIQAAHVRKLVSINSIAPIDRIVIYAPQQKDRQSPILK